MIKETIDIVSRHQDQLSFLQQQYSKATKESEKFMDKGDCQPRMRCGRCRRKHREVDCPLTNGTCFRCRQHGHLVANCPLNVQGTSIQAESGSKSVGFKRPKQDEEIKRALKTLRNVEQMNSYNQPGEKWQVQPNNHKGNKKGKWVKNKNKKDNTACEHCGRNHDVKDCPWATEACFQ